MSEYDKSKITNTYYTILILDSCGDIFDELSKWQCTNNSEERRARVEWVDIIDACKRVIEMKKHDKELGSEFGVWDYRVVKHEEDEDNDWQTIYKVFKYRGKWKYKIDDNF